MLSRLSFVASGLAGALGGCVGSSRALTAPEPQGTGQLGTSAAPHIVASIAAVQLQVGAQLYVIASVPGQSLPQPLVVTDTTKLAVQVQPWDPTSWEIILSASSAGQTTVNIESPGLTTAAFGVVIAPASG